MVISFIISARNSIPSIMKTIKKISEKFGDKIEKEEPCLHFFADKNHELKLRDKAMTNVVDFLIRMSVLNFRNDNYVSVNDRLDNGEFSHYTTLDSKLQAEIGLAVEEIVERIGNKSQVRFLYPNTINLYHLEYVDKEDLASSVRKSATLLREKIIIIRNCTSLMRAKYC